ncbi:MAG: MraY family glycosyltransferase [Ekhidna sp.]
MSFTLAIVTSFLITLTLIPIVIRVSKSVNVLDQPDKRKIHSISTPSLGGVAIFFGFILALLLAVPLAELVLEKYFLGGILIIFLLGVRDDLSSLQAKQKILVQLFSAILVVFFAGIKIEGLNGLFGVNSFPWYFDEIFTLFVIVVMTNAFNLIDGIDGLAGSIAMVISLSFGFLFFISGAYIPSIVSLSVAGAALAFLIYNWYPSKVFMGDTGSMMLGFALTVLLIKYLQIPSSMLEQVSPVAIMLSLFILPFYDTLRVFLIRFFSGKHPLSPDRNHIHHVLLKLGLNHGQATISLVTYNVAIVSAVFFFQSVGELWLILIMVLLTVGCGALLDRKVLKRETARMARLVSSEIKMSKTA